MADINQKTRLHPAPVLDFPPAAPTLDGCPMTPEPSLISRPASSLPSRPLSSRKRTGAAAADALRQQARIAALGAAG